MVQRSEDTLEVLSVVNGNSIYKDQDPTMLTVYNNKISDSGMNYLIDDYINVGIFKTIK